MRTAALVTSALVVLAGCAHVGPRADAAAPATTPPPTAAPANEAPPPAVAEVVPASASASAPAQTPVVSAAPARAAAQVVMEDEADDGADDPGEEAGDVAESVEGDAAATDEGPRYSKDITDEALERLWKDTPELLGSISFGFAHEGRLLNAVRFPEGDGAWRVVSPHAAFATQETVDYVTTAIREVKKLYPEAPPLRVNQISGPEGGYLRPHRSHQNGRDVDLAFYYPTAEPIRAREREKYIDVEKNWALVKALVTLTDVQLILVDRRVQKVLYDHALAKGEDKVWLDSLFNAGADSLIKHAKRHRDHFHIRFYNGRAQELGRRLAPLLALRPEQNIAIHRVRSGNTLGHLAVRYNSSVKAIMKLNRMKSTFLRLGQVLKIPLRKPCTRCPVPPQVVIPPRRLPPAPPLPTSDLGAPGASIAAAR